MHDAVHLCLSPLVLSVLFWSRTTCTSTKAFIMVYHLQYSLFCFDLVQHANTQRSSSLSVYHLLYSVVRSELVQHADAQRSSSPSNTGVSKTWPAGHTQPQSSPWSYSNYRMWPNSVSKNFLHLNCTLSNVHRIKTACYLWKLIYNTNHQKQKTLVNFKFNYKSSILILLLKYELVIMVCWILIKAFTFFTA